MDKVQDPNQMSIALAAQLFLSHFLVGLAALVIFGSLDWLSPLAQIIFTILATGSLGLILNLNLQRSLRMLDWALLRLTAVQPITHLATRGHGAMSGIMAKLQILVERERPFAHLRAQQMQQASEAAAQETRNRLARDLHDSIKQQLFSINVSAAAAQARLEKDMDGTTAALDDVRHSAKAALVEMNALLQQLSPEPLAKVGLVQALQEQCEALNYRSGANVQVQIGDLPDDERFPLGAQETLFRIAQEALSNVARHARAEQVWLRLEMGGERGAKSEERGDRSAPFILRPSSLLLEIRDDGQGFEQTAVSSGMGLDNMRQRVQEIGGQLHITSAPHQGTSVQILIPLEDVIIEAKEQEMIKPDHALNRFSLISFGGGVAVTAVLFYPLYNILLGRFVSGWSAGLVQFIMPSIITAVLLTIIISTTAVKQLPLTTRIQNSLAGTIAGIISGLTVFFMIGGSAASVWGSQILIQRGFGRAQTESEFLYHLSESITGNIWAVYGSFWLVFIAAALLGTIGGLMVHPQPTRAPERWLSLRSLLPLITNAAHLISLASLFFTIAIFSLLGEPVAKAATDFAIDGFFLTLPVAGIDFWPIFTTLTIYLLSLALHTWVLWRNRHSYPTAVAQRDYVGTVYTAVLVTAVFPILIGFIWRALFTSYALIGFFINLAFSLFLLWHANQTIKSFPALWREGVWVAEGISWLTIILPFIFAWQSNFELAFYIYLLGIVIFLSTNRRDPLVEKADKVAFARRRLSHALTIFFSSILAITLPVMITPTVALGLIQISVASIAPLTPDSTVTVTRSLITQIQQLYWLQPAFLTAILIASAILISIAILIIKLLSRRKVN